MSTTPSHTLRAGLSLGEGLRTLRAMALALDNWLETRRRAYEDGIALAEMSDRDLHDIGLDRGFVSAVAQRRWTRESPDV